MLADIILNIKPSFMEMDHLRESRLRRIPIIGRPDHWVLYEAKKLRTKFDRLVDEGKKN